ncbi:ROK family transcriptional regulator [Leeia sp. TBRC 13508]|uniref:ROK family transcriptional regulator n=1 Tax=Leeia speluncae TaxID=2884804 RepID=A0ABS8D9X1_9NEIS|nr:ROK family transcriptional regulator [Leeia speluncae]MCB6184996.1 ROK family transcriptional regulator [Leeia speluncae]
MSTSRFASPLQKKDELLLSDGKLQIQSQIAQLITKDPGISRADLAKITGLARSTIAEYLQPLMDCGLVIEQRGHYSGRGRPSNGLTLNSKAGVVLVADIGVTHGRLLVSDLAGTWLADEYFKPDLTIGPEKLLDEIVDRFNQLVIQSGSAELAVRSVTIGIPSPVDFEKGMPVSPPVMPGWDNFPVAKYLKERLKAPVLVDNDVNLMALGEASSRPISQSPLLFIKVATGIGSGIVTKDGELHRGADGAAGDIGHIRVTKDTAVICRCGNVGCIEALASASAIMRQLQEIKGADFDPNTELATLISTGDAQAVRLLRNAASEIGEIVAMLVHIYNPASIILGGKLAHMSDDLLAGIRAVVYRRALPLATRKLLIEKSELSKDAGLIGGVSLATSKVLSPAGIRDLIS